MQRESDDSDGDGHDTAASARKLGGSPALLEKIIRERIYETVFWKQHCHHLNEASILDAALAHLHAIGGCTATSSATQPQPTPFLSLALRLMHLNPVLDVVVAYLEQDEFKYVRALGAFYLRICGCNGGLVTATWVYKYLEPLLEDRRRLRFQQPGMVVFYLALELVQFYTVVLWIVLLFNLLFVLIMLDADFPIILYFVSHTVFDRFVDGKVLLTFLDVFVDQLLTEDRVCDTALPHLPRREVLEDAGFLEPRISPLQHLVESDDDDDDNDGAVSDDRSRSISKERRSPSAERSDSQGRSLRDRSRVRSRSRHSTDRRSRSRSRHRSHYRSNSRSRRDHSPRRDRSRSRQRSRSRDRSRSSPRYRHRSTSRRRDRSRRSPPYSRSSNKLRFKSSSKPKAHSVERRNSGKNNGDSGGGGGFREEMSIEETNKMRASLGLPPLK